MNGSDLLPTHDQTLEQHRESFREEAREILRALESSLLELNAAPKDKEIVGSVFRSMHTIKGSGAMFGFDEVAAFTHHLETAFDGVRKGSLQVTPELIDLSLTSLDQIERMLEEGGDQANDSESAAIVERLQRMTGTSEAKKSDSVSSLMCSQGSADDALHTWKILFAPSPDVMKNGTNPLLLLRELERMGELKVIADTRAIPSLEMIDPEQCYLSWEMILSTAAPRTTLQDVFIFIEGSCELSIEPWGGQEPGHDLTMKEADGSGRLTVGRRGSERQEQVPSLRVPTAKLDQFVNLVGELVTAQARLTEIASRSEDPDVANVAEEMERLTASLRESSMSVRLVPVRATFERFRRLVHDLARDLQKKVELSIEGADTELDKTVIDQLSDPLMHLIRNSMDHGIENPDARLAAGKSPVAKICLSARQCGANVLISVEDDGRGINSGAVRERAVEAGLVKGETALTEAEIYSFIMKPGFSTSREITDISGRGVGMDVVHQSVEALRGSIDIASKFGVGTSITLRLPLTLAIIDGLLVRVEDAYFVLPLANTLECIELTKRDVELANGKCVISVRGEIIPYIRLREFFGVETARPDREQIMITEAEDGRYGFVVDEVLGDHQTVIKHLGRLYRQVQFVSGATILGNGSVALILDPHRLVQEVVRGTTQSPRGRPQALERVRRSLEIPQASA
ncbi:MAG: chemotaxis protein CheA [Acidobacteriaceae bacterium]